jgi:cephalosporin hydroxylase
MENVKVEDVVNYCVRDFFIDHCDFQQVYEEIITFGYWIKGFEPKNILEIGCKGSTFFLFSKFSNGKKVAVDIDDRNRELHHFMFGEDWKFFQGNSQTEEMKQKVSNFCLEYDFIFIDGDHSYNGVKKDFELYKDLLSPRGYVVFHDIDPNHIFKGDKGGGDVWQFWQDLNIGSKINIVAQKSSGIIKCFGANESFGGIGLWKP